MYYYLLGTGILGAVWGMLYLLKPKLRSMMIFGGLSYLLIFSVGFACFKIIGLFTDMANQIIPSYWFPKTLFDLGAKTGGYSIEDAFFMFFLGGAASIIYEALFKIKIKRHTHHHYYGAISIATLITALTIYVFRPNPIYSIIVFNMAGTLVLWLQRPDLITHSIWGGILLLLLYFLIFVLFNHIARDFVSLNYNLQNISGRLVAGVPLEELLYSISFGMLWAPFYEYFYHSHLARR